jgi:hypothetical protein
LFELDVDGDNEEESNGQENGYLYNKGAIGACSARHLPFFPVQGL